MKCNKPPYKKSMLTKIQKFITRKLPELLIKKNMIKIGNV